MMKSIHYATNLEAFLDVVRARSFSAAARRRGNAPSSVVRQIDALEAELGTKLFVRSTRLLTLTDAGERLLPRAVAILEQLLDTRAEIAALDEVPRGTLRVSCVPTFSRRYLIPVVEPLLARYPDLRVDLDITERPMDPAAGRHDAVIRIGALPDSALIATPLAMERWVVCASQAYLAKAGIPKTPTDLLRHRRIDKLNCPPGFGWNRLLPNHSGAGYIPPVLRSDDFEAERVAALGDIGLAFLPTWVVGPDIRERTLVKVLDDIGADEIPIQILRTQRKAAAKLLVFIDAVRRYIGQPPIWEPGATIVD
jgi:DNA-binding transcriptional LysR family regulator